LRFLGEELVKCLNCGALSFSVKFYVYEAPLVGNVLIEHGYCTSCSFRKSDVMVIDSGEPKLIRAYVKSENDLKAIVVKSASASIVIPELGVEIAPGVAAYGYITTIEGILERVIDVIPSDCFEDRECSGRVEEIRKAMRGEREFTLIIKDPLGRSAVRGEGIEVVEEKLINLNLNTTGFFLLSLL